jgi:hypothetical protein
MCRRFKPAPHHFNHDRGFLFTASFSSNPFSWPISGLCLSAAAVSLKQPKDHPMAEGTLGGTIFYQRAGQSLLEVGPTAEQFTKTAFQHMQPTESRFHHKDNLTAWKSQILLTFHPH